MWTVVWLDTAEDKPLKLTGFTEGSLAVYYALRDACRPMNVPKRPHTSFCATPGRITRKVKDVSVHADSTAGLNLQSDPVPLGAVLPVSDGNP
jgi:hypothetical protein